MNKLKQYRFKSFMTHVLNGVGSGIVAGVIAKGILGELVNYLSQSSELMTQFGLALTMFQFLVPVGIGMLIGMEFELDKIQTACLGGATLVGSGALHLVDGTWQMTGIGDIINIIVTASIAAFLIMLVDEHVGHFGIMVIPVVGIIAGFIGMFTLPYAQAVTQAVSQMVLRVTELSPLPMTILLGVIFAYLVISPLTSSGVAIAISLSGIGSGAAALGISSCFILVGLASSKVNNRGVTMAIFLGGVKIMMRQFVSRPMMWLPIGLGAAISGACAYFFNIQGTPISAGFGYNGLMGPVNAYPALTQTPLVRILILAIVFFVIPYISAKLIHYVMIHKLKLYTYDLFKFD